MKIKKQLKKLPFYLFIKGIILKLRNRKKVLQDLSNEKKLFGQIISNGNLCFDVGANIGERTKFFLSLGAMVVAVEPQPSCLKNLKKKYKNNKYVTIVEKGLSDAPGLIKMAVCDDSPTISTMSEKWRLEGRFSTAYKWDRFIDVNLTTLDSLIESYGVPKYCKIDVEGYEYNVIKGLKTPIEYLSFEFTKEFVDDAEKCLDYLSQLGTIEVNIILSPGTYFTSFGNPSSIIQIIKENPNKLFTGDIMVHFIQKA